MELVTRRPTLTHTWPVLCAIAFGAACTSNREDIGPHGDGLADGDDPAGSDDGDDVGSSGDGSGGDDGGDDGGNGDDGDGIKYDVEDGNGSGGPGDEQEECHKVDFLFVVDNSDSMLEFQTNLVDNWPAFVSGIQSTLTEVDSYHVGVTSTDEAYPFNVQECRVMGGLIVDSYAYQTRKTCGPYANGLSFMTEADDLNEKFNCAAIMEYGTSYEKPMANLQAAVERQFGGPGQCNEGFLRDDSMLIIVILTDECDGFGCLTPNGNAPSKSPGGPDEWFDAVVAARGGIETNIVVMSLLHYDGGECPPPHHSQHGYFDGIRIKEFTEMFTHGIVGGICETDYGPYFQQAISVIDVACEEYVPPEG